MNGLSKLYRIGAPTRRYKTLRESLTTGLKSFGRRAVHLLGTDESNGHSKPTIWALKEVSFEIPRGEVVGIIGRNGAGKSTLLKILSRITEPTAGTIQLRGRVGSLLEVGTGFHPELTGRENIYLNGAIIGMSRAEVARKFDEIVSFSEISQFIDTAVKHYSSGMYLRLAFAVAAHLEPEILLVDEVLAVGDATFQQKCIGKMGEVAREGRTVLFVSHNLGAVATLCTTTLLLINGAVESFGQTSSVIQHYLQTAYDNSTTQLSNYTTRPGAHGIVITSLAMHDNEGCSIAAVPSGTSVSFRIGYELLAFSSVDSIDFEVRLRDSTDSRVVTFSTWLNGKPLSLKTHQGFITCHVPTLPLAPDVYRIEVNCTYKGIIQDVALNVSTLAVVDGTYYGSGTKVTKHVHGVLLAYNEWRT